MLGNFDQCVSLGKTVSLCPASFCTPRPNLSVIPGISWLSTFVFQSPMMKRTSFWGVIEGLVGPHVWMWELDYKESWVPKNWCFWTMVLEKTLESPLDCKEIQPVPPKGNQSWIFIGRTDAEAETPVLRPPDAKSGLIWKDPDAGKDWRQEEKVMIEDEMVGWHHWLDGHEFKQATVVGDGQGSLACCSPWGCNEFDTAELNWTKQKGNSSRAQVTRASARWEHKKGSKTD